MGSGSAGDEAEWDTELREWGGHFLQSSAWGRVQEALGFEVVRDRGPGWGWSGAVRQGLAPRYLYSPYGPTVTAGTLGQALASAAAAGRECRLDFLRLEPLPDATPAQLVGLGARPAQPVQPPHTWIVDLDAEEPVLRSRLSQSHRRNVAAASRRGLSFRRSRDPAEVGEFIALIAKTGARGGFTPQPDRYYRTVVEVLMPLGAASLFLAEAEGSTVAAVIGFDSASTRYYAHAAADPAVSRRISAGVPLAWWMICNARAEGKAHFDFWGVAPADDAGHPWAGLSRFKRGFGGRPVDRVGTWELPLRPLRYGTFSLARSLAGRLAARDRPPE